jgi:hypothetical protein
MNTQNLVKRWKELKRENYNCINLKTYFLYNAINYIVPENIFYPILIGKNLIQFTNIVFISNGSGDSYYLVLISGKYQFFKIGFEPDCDGAYYYGHEVAFLEVINYINDFQVVECYTDSLLKDLTKI